MSKPRGDFDSFVLAEKYADEPTCQDAARLAAGAAFGDALDAGFVSSILDQATGVQLMRCYGMSSRAIALYFLALLVVLVALIVSIPYAIDDASWERCKVCVRRERRWRPRGGSRTVCVERRDGTPAECRREGAILEYVISAAVALATVGLIQVLVLFYLKSQIFTSRAFFADMFARFLF